MNYKVLSKYNILFVEDEEHIRDASVELFSLVFDNVYSACDGVEGLNIFKESGDIDIIMSNINMLI